jgi:hypothetical protein
MELGQGVVQWRISALVGLNQNVFFCVDFVFDLNDIYWSMHFELHWSVSAASSCQYLVKAVR